jgi:hypothetical protein
MLNVSYVFTPLFLVTTDAAGRASVVGSGLAKTLRVIDSWLTYSATSTMVGLSYPVITLFLTYEDANGTYFKQASIPLSPRDIAQGASYSLVETMNISGPPQLPPRPLLTGAPQEATYTTTGPGYVPAPSCGSGCAWFLNETIGPYPSTPGPVAVSWVQAANSAYAWMGFAMGQGSVKEFNLGVAFGVNIPGGGSVGFEAGGTVWEAGSLVYFLYATGTATDGNAAQVVVDGQIEGALFNEYVGYNPYMCSRYRIDCGQYTNNQILVASIVDLVVNTANDEVVGGLLSGLPPWINQFYQGFQLEYYGSYNGTGSYSVNCDGCYLNALDLVGTVKSSETTWISVGVPVGAILEAAIAAGLLSAPEFTIPPLILISVVGALSAQFSPLVMWWMNWNGPSGKTLYVYYWLSTAEYSLSNGGEGYIPIVGGYVTD